MKRRIVVVAVVVATVQKLHYTRYRFKRTAQVEYLILLKMSTLNAYTLYRSAHVKKELKREVIGFLLHTAELAGLRQGSIYAFGIAGESHVVHLVLAKLAQTVALQQRANLVELYLILKIIWINHGAKLLKGCLKTAENTAKIPM